MSTSDNLKYSIVDDICWIESEIGIVFYNISKKLICLPSIINITCDDLEIVIDELTKIKTLIKETDLNDSNSKI